MRTVIVNDLTSIVIGEIVTSNPTPIATRPSHTNIVLPTDGPSVWRHTWTGGTTFVPTPRAPIRTIPYSQFIDRFNQRAVVGSEAEVFERMGGTSDAIQSFNRRGQASGLVNLDATETIAMLDELKANGVPTPMWATDVIADVRIAALLADG